MNRQRQLSTTLKQLEQKRQEAAHLEHAAAGEKARAEARTKALPQKGPTDAAAKHSQEQEAIRLVAAALPRRGRRQRTAEAHQEFRRCTPPFTTAPTRDARITAAQRTFARVIKRAEGAFHEQLTHEPELEGREWWGSNPVSANRNYLRRSAERFLDGCEKAMAELLTALIDIGREASPCELLPVVSWASGEVWALASMQCDLSRIIQRAPAFTITGEFLPAEGVQDEVDAMKPDATLRAHLAELADQELASRKPTRMNAPDLNSAPSRFLHAAKKKIADPDNNPTMDYHEVMAVTRLGKSKVYDSPDLERVKLPGSRKVLFSTKSIAALLNIPPE